MVFGDGVSLPPDLAPEARDLLLGFLEWVDDHPALLDDPTWTREQMVDMFIMEAGGNGL